MPRHAFTLVEMLVVLGLMILVSGIALGSLGALRSGNRLVATRQLVTDLVRQARYTARASGMPAMLRITPTVGTNGRVTGGEISGLSQVTLAEEHFENDALWQSSAANSAPVMGRTGHGLQIQGDANLTTVPASRQSLRLDVSAQDRSRRVVRSRTTHDGFLLSAAVRLPLVPAGPYSGVYIPVALIGGPTEPRVDTALAGILVRQHVRPQQRMETNTTPSVTRFHTLNTWEILGFARDAGGTLHWLSSVDDSNQGGSLATTRLNPNDAANTLANWSDFRTVCSPNPDPLTPSLTWSDPVQAPLLVLIGERWVDVALMFDGRSLILLVDGAPICRRLVSSLFAATDDRQDYLWAGAAILPAVGGYDGRTWMVASGGSSAAVLDDLSLRRLGADTPTPLPTGVRPYAGTSATDWFEVTVLPDGRCTASGLTFAETSDPAFDSTPPTTPSSALTLTIDGNGDIKASEAR